jgi:hypothetical protein
LDKEKIKMKADAKIEAAMLAVMKEFAERYAGRGMKGVLALHAPDSDVATFTPRREARGT